MSAAPLRLVGSEEPTAASPGGIDQWGRSPSVADLANRLAALRWDVDLGGVHHLPRRHGALLVTNPRRLAWVPPMVALALSAAIDRPVRFAGHPDVAPFSTVLRRIGAVLARPDEVETALRDGDLVLVGAAPTTPLHRPWQLLAPSAGTVPAVHIAMATRAGVAVHPVAALTGPLTRAATVTIGAGLRPRHDQRGPLATADLVDRVQASLHALVAARGGEG